MIKVNFNKIFDKRLKYSIQNLCDFCSNQGISSYSKLSSDHIKFGHEFENEELYIISKLK